MLPHKCASLCTTQVLESTGFIDAVLALQSHSNQDYKTATARYSRFSGNGATKLQLSLSSSYLSIAFT
eukprot:COSAG02_NODE_4471_length_5328_cov_3.132721_4_plen_68_part_00